MNSNKLITALHNNIHITSINEDEKLFTVKIIGCRANLLHEDYLINVKFQYSPSVVGKSGIINCKAKFWDIDNKFTHSADTHFNNDESFCIGFPDNNICSEETYIEMMLSFILNQCYYLENDCFPPGSELPHEPIHALLKQYNTIPKLRNYFKSYENQEQIIYYIKSRRKFTNQYAFMDYYKSSCNNKHLLYISSIVFT